MALTGNPVAVGWKHNHEPGIIFKENSSGDMELIAWPSSLGSLPSQANLDTWETEYNARNTKEEIYNNVMASLDDDTKLLIKAIVLCAINGELEPGISNATAKANIKARL